MVSTRVQKWCAWGGVVNMSVYFIGMLFAHFLPIPSPAVPQDEVAAIFRDNATGIRIGSIFMLASGFFLVPLIGLISAFMKRIEGNLPIMAYGQLAAGALGILFFYVPAVLFFVMAYRPERSPEIIYVLYDFAWMFMIGAWPSFLFQQGCIALAIFSDKQLQPVFPRWLGYFQIWTALLYTGSCLLPFFKTGPFAWNGFFAFWIPAIVFFIWCFVMTAALLKTIDQQAAKDSAR